MYSLYLQPVVFCVRTLLSDIGRVRVIQGSARPAGQGSITAVAKGVGVPSGNFLTRHTCDMKFSYVSERLGRKICSFGGINWDLWGKSRALQCDVLMFYAS